MEVLMRTILLRFLLLFFAVTPLAGCEAIADIFRAGFWVGVILVGLLVVVIVVIVGMFRR
jgi:hypothetical protein